VGGSGNGSGVESNEAKINSLAVHLGHILSGYDRRCQGYSLRAAWAALKSSGRPSKQVMDRCTSIAIPQTHAVEPKHARSTSLVAQRALNALNDVASALRSRS